MSRTSQLYNMYADRLNRVQTPDELVQLSREINASSLKSREKTALALACIFAAKYFDKHGGKLNVQDPALECPDQV